MDASQFATSIGVIGLILLMVLLVLHFFGPRTAAWIQSNREEKMGFSKNRIYNANGYLIQSGSELLLTTSGSFKHFDSIDRDYKPDDQASDQSSTFWNITVPEVPPQPLRPAPKSPTLFERAKSMDKSPKKYTNVPIHGISSGGKSTVIPRPVTKRQFSSPASCSIAHINLSDVVAKINSSGPKSCTNPFRNGLLSHSADDNSNRIDFNETVNPYSGERYLYAQVIDEKSQKNPFRRQQQQQQQQHEQSIDDQPFFLFPSNGNINDITSTLTASYDDGKYIEETTTTPMLIELNEEEEAEEEDIVDDSKDDDGDDNCNAVNEEEVKLLQIATNTSDSSTFSSHTANVTTTTTTKSISPVHNRSLSDAGSALPTTCKNLEQLKTVNPFNAAQNLHKTVSDTYLEKYAMQKSPPQQQQQHSPAHQSFNRTSSRQSIDNSNSLPNDPANNPSTPLSVNESEMKRAMSCESINSESSVLLADLEPPQTIVYPTVTGQLCVGLQYDKNTLTEDGIELVLTVMEAKELIGPSDTEQFDTFVRIYMIPEREDTPAQQTKVFRNSKCPSYNETISFWLSNKGPSRRSLIFHLYHSGNINTLIGETEFQIGDVRRPITTWLTLSDSRLNYGPYGELMFSLSYLPTAERLTVVVVKARKLKLNEADSNKMPQNVFVKVYLQKNDKKVSKKKTSMKRADSCPIFNEAMIFSVPPYMLNAIQIRMTVVGCSPTDACSMQTDTGYSSGTISNAKPIGHVIVGCHTSDKGSRHWIQMLSSLRKPVAMWHAIQTTVTHSTINKKNEQKPVSSV